jgi:hypothetical protein
MVLWCSPRQVSVERGHEETQELLVGVLVEQQLVVRLLRPGLWVFLEELLEQQLVVLPWEVAKQVDLQFRNSKEPLWPLLGVLVSCCKNPTRAAAFLSLLLVGSLVPERVWAQAGVLLR